MKALKKAKNPNRRKGKSALFDKKQEGYTLVEIILAAALISAASILVMDKNIADLEHQKARELGLNLFDYGNAVRQYIAFNPDAPDIPETGSITGVAWLQDSSDPECIGATGNKAYLPCTFPKKLFGDVQIETSKKKHVLSEGEFEDVLEGEYVSVTSTIDHIKTGDTVRPDLSGIAAMVASAGTVEATDVTPQTTNVSFKSYPLENGKIEIKINNGVKGDIWVRIDKPVVRDSLTFHPDGGPEKREIKNASAIRSLKNQGLLFSAGSGSVTIGSNTEIKNELRVAGQTTLSILETTGNVKIGGNLKVDQGADITGNVGSNGYFYTGNNTTFRMQPHETSTLNRVNATRVDADRVDVADLNVTGNHLMINKTVAPGGNCPGLNGAIGRDAGGKILSCQSGIWKNQGTASPLLFGGAWHTRPGGCSSNPLTGSCSCPSGYSATRVSGSHYDSKTWNSFGYVCWKFP